MKTYTSENGWFSMELPLSWEEYDCGEDGAYAFFDTNSWTGNLRIIPFRLARRRNPSKDIASIFIQDEVLKNDGANRIQLGDFDCAHFRKNIQQNDGDLFVYYWITGMGNNLFICTFTVDHKQEKSDQHPTDLETVQNILQSIRMKQSVEKLSAA
ncbi:DUF3805 domain-containing protein [Cytophagaceae bacterium DM2B3-1]|uniref:DUF3805 domain-containing protein n=1 Tax=Xanthocytophaga flava TaxID=3048013 RepID=A0ABT7CE67_9BACT|nr:DUF3805 domain-containing protein [Xanthocytophaga flavus]MDJ1492032.1 DUF3805 domain-containing protein [Xanthocytophaga flavus]